MATLTELYDLKLGAGELLPDADQKRTVACLENLRVALLHYRPLKKRGLFGRLLARPANEHAPRGCYLYGGVGRGKSMVMDIFFASVETTHKRRVHFHAFMLEVHDFLHARRTARAKGEDSGIDDDLIACADHIASQSWLLCFDEFQVKDVADAMILGRLFTALFERGVVIVITSNIAPERLYEDGLQRDRFLPFIELLRGKLDLLHFTGDTDYRLGRLRDMKVYFWPHDADAMQALDAIFRTVADGLPGEPCDITVKGRVIHVPRAVREVAQFTFAELCEEPKSALDYLELVRRYRVFIVSGVPVLNDDKKDAVTRFVTLIDMLYDHHALIALSAAALPDALYRGQDMAGVFGRTISRLAEMQSRKYRDL